MTHIPRIGIGGPVGSGKSMLIERLVPMLAEVGYSISIISNDVISKEDADSIVLASYQMMSFQKKMLIELEII